MKNLIILLSFVFVLTSCKKQYIEPTSKLETVQENNTSVSEITWRLYSAKVYLTNLSNGNKTFYDHFSSSKNTSNLDVFSPTFLEFDDITKNITTWEFRNSGIFILNNTNTYNLTLNSNGIYRVYGLENGSSRIIEVLKSTNDYMTVKVYESNGNDGSNNYSFFSLLTFVKVGFGGVPEEFVYNDYVYSGVIGGVNQPQTLVGTKWVINRYVQNFVSIYPNDTLTFVSNNQYKINNQPLRNYSLSGVVGNNMKSLSLYSFTTLGGDWSGQVQGTFINDWVINNAVFTDMFNTNNYETRIWMTRIQ